MSEQYFSHEPLGDTEFHDTPEAARRAADKALEYAEFQLDDGSPGDSDHNICWGLVLGRVSVEDRDPTPEEKAERPEIGFIRTMDLEDSPARRLWEAAPDLLEALRAAKLELFHCDKQLRGGYAVETPADSSVGKALAAADAAIAKATGS